MNKSLDPEYPKAKKDSTSNETSEKKPELFPTEVIDLPSQGLVYPQENPLSSGQIEMRYPSARDEDILTSQNLIQKGVVIDKLLESLIVSDIDYDDLVIGDKNALIMAARVLGYGKNYNTEVQCPRCGEKEQIDIDLLELKDKEVDTDKYNRQNSYEFTLPKSGRKITFKLLTNRDEKKITEEIKRIKAFNKKSGKKEAVSPEFTTRLKYMILSVDGRDEIKVIREFVDKELVSQDTYEFRKHLREFTPDIDSRFLFECSNCGEETVLAVPMTVEFFWPESGV